MAVKDYRTSAQVAKVFGMTSKRVQQLTADGVIETEATQSGRRYDWDKTVAAYVAYLTQKAYGRERKEDIQQLEKARIEAEVAIKKSKAAIARMEQEQLAGSLLLASDVEAITTDHVLYFRSILMGLPGKLAVDLAGDHTAAEQAVTVQREVNGILEALANYRFDPAEYERRLRERRGWERRADPSRENP